MCECVHTSQPLSNYFIISYNLSTMIKKMLQPYNVIINFRNMTWMHAHDWIEISFKVLKKNSLNIPRWWQKSYNFLPQCMSWAECLLHIHFVLLVSIIVCRWKSESHHNKQQIAGISLRTRFEVGERDRRGGYGDGRKCRLWNFR